MPQHPGELDRQEEELKEKGLLVRRAAVEATTEPSVQNDEAKEEESTVRRQQQPPQQLDRQEAELNEKGVLAFGSLDANIGVLQQGGKLTTSEKKTQGGISVLSEAGALPVVGSQGESGEEEGDRIFSTKTSKHAVTGNKTQQKLGAIYVEYTVNNPVEQHGAGSTPRTGRSADDATPLPQLHRSHRVPPPPAEPGAIPVRLTSPGRALAEEAGTTDSGHFSSVSPPPSGHFDLHEVETTADAARDGEMLVSATVVDEEMQTKVAEDKARDTILQEMVQGEAMILEEKSKNKKWAIGIAMVAVIVLVILVAVLAGDKNGNEEASNGGKGRDTTTTTTTISDYDYLVQVLSPIAGEEQFQLQDDSDKTSLNPRNKAFYWMLEEDNFWRSYSNITDTNTTIQMDESLETLIMERYILVVLHYSTEGENWLRDLSFLSTNASVCNWPPVQELEVGEEITRTDGVSCNALHRVTDINLSGINLNGTIPPELGKLEFLRNIRMEDNQLHGTIPDSLSQLNFLTLFQVPRNHLSGTIPESLAAGLNNLESLNLDSNMLSGTLPRGIFHIESLKQFVAGSNHLTGTIPEFPARGKLEDLWLGNNQLEGSIPPSFFTSTKIQSLGLYLNKLTGTLPPSIGNFADMNIMYLDGNHLNGTLPKELGLLRSMEFLWLNYNDFTGAIPSQLGNLGKFGLLSELVLSFTKLSGEVPSELGQLESIFTVDLANTSISGSLDHVFCEGLSIPKLTSDCGSNSSEVQCSCCTACCDDQTGDCVQKVDQICSLMAESVKDPEQPLEFVLMQDDVKPLNPSCECSEIPPIANLTSSDGKVPVMTLSCHESQNCIVCTPDGLVCGRRFNFGFTWDENGIWTHQTMGFQYTKGREDLLLLEFDVSSQSPPYLYKMHLKGELCSELNAEAICADGQPAFEIDCSNVQEGAVYSQCDGLVQNAGALEYFTPTMYGVSSKCDNKSGLSN